MEKINFINNSTPALNATNLNKLQDNIEDALNEAAFGDQEVVVGNIRTKNMFDTRYVVPATSGPNTDVQDTNSVSINGITKDSVLFTTSANWQGFASDYIEVKQNTKYTASVQVSWVTELYIRVFCYDASKTLIADYSQAREITFTITTPANTKYVRVLIARITASSTELTCSNIQFEEGETATTYSPYQTLDSNSTMKQTLRAVSTYFSTIDVNKVVKNGAIIQVSFRGLVNTAIPNNTPFMYLPPTARPEEGGSTIIKVGVGGQYDVNDGWKWGYIGNDGSVRCGGVASGKWVHISEVFIAKYYTN